MSTLCRAEPECLPAVATTAKVGQGNDLQRKDASQSQARSGLAGDRRVVKCTKPGKFGLGHGPKGRYGTHSAATPLFYLERLELMNQEFPTDIRLEGIVLGKSDRGNEEDLRPFIVTSQRLIEPVDKQRPNPTEPEIEGLMLKLGFKLLRDQCYNWIRESDRVIVTDAKMLNFITTDEGIRPIDLIISKDQSSTPNM
jgi:hypothetical protein